MIAVIQEEKAKKAAEEAKAKENSAREQGDVVNKVGTTESLEGKNLDDQSKKSPPKAAAASTSSPAAAGGKSASQTTGEGKPKMKPVSITPIPNTPWCVVWTDKGRVFYFNPTTNASVWVRPVELRDREEVDKLVNTPPANLTASSTSNSQQQPDPGSQSNGLSEDSKRPTSAAPLQPEKKAKLDINISIGGASLQTGQTTAKVAASGAPKVVKKEVASEIEKEAAKKRETVPIEERIDTFRKMLEENKVDHTSTFERELSKIVYDPRYLLLTSTERREIFKKFCSEKIEEQQRKRREKIKAAESDFKALLAEAELTSRSTYEEFHDNYSKDLRYQALEKTKDREILFDYHMALLRRKEREERSQQQQQQQEQQKQQQQQQQSVQIHHRHGRQHNDERRSHSRHRSSSRSAPRDEIQSVYQALLVELITETDIDWHEAKRIMRKSPQWSYVDSLPRDWMEMQFERHLDKIYSRRKEKFQALLSETKEVNLASCWRDIKRVIRDDPRYIKFASPSTDRRCEREFRNFLKKRRAQAEEEFRQLLRETTLIDKDTRRKIEESEHQHLIDIIGTLQSDRRYVELEPVSEDRRKILLNYIEELAAGSSVTAQAPAQDAATDQAAGTKAAEATATTSQLPATISEKTTAIQPDAIESATEVPVGQISAANDEGVSGPAGAQQ